MKFKGIMPALVTPLNSDETINTQALDKLMSYLLTKGADGFYVGGATGEGIALKTENRAVLAEASVKASGGKPCIIQVAAADFSDAIYLAKQAESVGAAAISATAPLFFSYDADDIYNYYKALANAVHIPLMIYYNPAAGFNMNATFAARAFEIDNVTAIKWTSSNYYEMMRLKDLTHGEMNIINGPDEMLLMGLTAGADGGIGTNYNILMDYIRPIYDHFVAGDIDKAREAQYIANRIITVMMGTKIIPAVKVVLEDMGFEVGNATFPMKRYTKEQADEIIAAVKKAGFTY
jgi:N-acetylneuraminate lyase